MQGIVVKSTGSWYSVLGEDGQKRDCRIKGKFRMEGIKNTNPVAVGDKVNFTLTSNSSPGGRGEQGVIISIEKRRNYIIRKSTNLSKQTHIIAANIDQAFLIVTLALPRTSLGFIDRFLLTAEAYGIPAYIVFNKTDIYPADGMEIVKQLTELYEKIGYNCFNTSALQKTGIEELKKSLQGKVNLVAGHSGVGKSTLVNLIEPGLNLKTGVLSEAHDKGTHTTTFAEMFQLDGGGFIIDTPGLKEFGIVDMQKAELAHYFPEMRSLMNQCKYNSCIHLNEPECAVMKAVEQGTVAESRYRNYLNILSGEELKGEFE